MRSGFLVLCSLVTFALGGTLRGQGLVPPTITTHPVSVDAFVNELVVLTAGVAGSAPIEVKWFKNGTLIPGATSTQLVFVNVALADAANYTLTATNAAGSDSTSIATISVSKRNQTIAFNPPTHALAGGGGVTLSASSSAGLPVTLQLVSGTGALNGNNVLTSLGGTVVVRATQAGTDAINAAEPVERTLTFITGAIAPFITSPPLDQTVNAGATVSLHAAVIGTPTPTYQWFKDGIALAGATTSTLTLPTVTLADTARYGITVANFLGTATASATLTVRAPPVFTTMPATQAVSAGDAVSFTVATSGFPAPTYQWRRNGTAIPGATAATFRIAAAAATDAARYEVVATNALGSVTSAAATLTVATRDLSGTYFGRFGVTGSNAAPSGDFVLLVRANRTATFLGQLAGNETPLIAPSVTVDLAGNFSQVLSTGTRNVTLRGQLDEAGALTGTIAELAVALAGTRAGRTGPATAQAGLYQLALVGSATARGYVVVAPDGQALVMTAAGAGAESTRGTIGANGRLTLTTASQAALDLGFNNGALTGTVRAGTTTGVVSGAIETLLGREHLTNLSVRSLTQNATPLITGFVIGGTTPKQVMIRAAGPALAQAPFNVAGALGDPTLQVLRGNNVVGQNDEWGTPAANGVAVTAAATRTGAFPFRAGSADAALVATLQPGPYTVMIGGGNGTVLAEIYEVMENNEVAGARRLANTSARGLVSAGNPLIAGFVITGTAPQRVLIRGIGPTLGTPPFNVPGALPNPQLTLFRDTTVVKTNDDWFRDPEATVIRDATARAGGFALGAQSVDAAMLVYLEPGAYTAQVSGPPNANANNSTGIALVEVYEAAP